jgi:hypothetical protein
MHTCPNCDAKRPFELELWVTNRYVRFNACQHCQRQWWDDVRSGAALTVDELMAVVDSPLPAAA